LFVMQKSLSLKPLGSKLFLPLIVPIVAATICASSLSITQSVQAQPVKPEPTSPQPTSPEPTPPPSRTPAPARRAPSTPSTSSSSTQFYSPLPMPSSNEVSDTLTDKDIPTGSGGFYRDYRVTFAAGDQVVMDLTSEEFDTIISLIAPDGSTVTENDDGPDGTTNSLLFARITRPGDYVIRVSPYAGQGMGGFKLKVTRLRPV
jgi:Bacterial pre-peptidase C-terminal domain